MSTVLEAALALVARTGWPVFPTVGKVPAIKGGRGLYDATADPDALRDLFARAPNADGFGVNGGAAGITVLDPDVKNGIDGRETLREAGLPYLADTTPRALTPGGGSHVFYAGTVPSRDGVLPNVDIKSAGGYVILPPAPGRLWEADASPWDVPLAPVPDWLRKLAERKEHDRQSDGAVPAPADELRDDDAAGLAYRLVARCASAIAGGAKRHDTIRGAILQARHNRVPYGIVERMLPALLDAANAIPGKEPYPLAQLQRLLRWIWEHVTPGEPWEETKRKLESYREDDETHAPAWRSLTDVLRAARPREPLPTGFPLLDSTFLGGGLAPGDAVAVGGPPGSAKTTLVCALAANFAGPKTHVGFAAFDEPEEKVGAKVGARFGEAFHRLNADYPSVLESLEERLAIKDASVEFVDPLGAPDVETILETFAARVPAGRIGVLFLDHLHLLESRDGTERDDEFATIRKVATAVAVLTRKLGLITVSVAEVLKAASSPDAVRNNPLGAFAGTRKIASLFTVPMVMVPADGGGYELILAKNRLGPRGSAVLNVNYETWNVTVDSVRTAGRGTGTLGEESRTATVAKADDDVLRTFFAESEPMPWADAESALGARGVPRDRAAAARRRLRMAGALVEVPGVRRSGAARGPVPSFWAVPEKLSETLRNSPETIPAGEFLSPKETLRACAPIKGRAESFSERKPKRATRKKRTPSRRVSPSPEAAA